MRSENLTQCPGSTQEVRLHLTNVAGLGAVQLMKSLLPRMEAQPEFIVSDMYLPTRGDLAGYKAHNAHTRVHRFKRFLPNAISRVLECSLFGRKFDGAVPLLVLGDIPIRCEASQTVFVQTPLLTLAGGSEGRAGALKYWIARKLFRHNSRHVSRFIVQTVAMKDSLEQTYPEIEGRVHVVGQPPPEWLLESGLRRDGPAGNMQQGLRLFYPAASYPHKNHSLLAGLGPQDDSDLHVQQLLLTIRADLHPNAARSWIQCVGRLVPAQVLRAYSESDALLFLSQSESLGFPLIEAMWVGLPIICADLPYARVLCGDQAIYFDPREIDSLRRAIVELRRRLQAGWWPDWQEQLADIPRSWDDVAHDLLRLVADPAA